MTESDNKYSIPASFYRAFEDRFRGSQELIFKRLEVYVPFLRAIVTEHGKAKGLDLGCGRGEWLRILEREGIEAKGVDVDQAMLDAARGHGLTVECKDALQALSETPDGSLALVTGFHIIEHLPFGVMLTLITEARRVLRPGGLLILETPNPENVLVGTWSFHLDPTHVKPIPPILMPFLAEYAGFNETTILRLNAEDPVDGVSLTNVFTKVSLDFAVLARVDGGTSDVMVQLFQTEVGLDIFGALSDYDVRANGRWAAVEHVIDDLKKDVIRISNEATVLRKEMSRQSAELSTALAGLRGDIDYVNGRSAAERLLFRPSGRPVKFLRRLAFHKNGRPRGGLLGRIARKKNGRPRKCFARWFDSKEYASLPWPAQQSGRLEGSALVSAGLPEEPLRSSRAPDNLIGLDPRNHPRRYAIWARLSAARQAGRMER